MVKTISLQDINKNTYHVSVDQLAWRPSVYAIIIRDGHILLSRENGTYSLPGGGVMPGEGLDEALKREVIEETGVTIGSLCPLSFASTYFALDNYPATETKNYIQSIMLLYTAQYVSGDISLDYEAADEKGYHAMAEWVLLEEVPTIDITSNYDWRVLLRGLK